jgi:hypothetical protein
MKIELEGYLPSFLQGMQSASFLTPKSWRPGSTESISQTGLEEYGLHPSCVVECVKHRLHSLFVRQMRFNGVSGHCDVSSEMYYMLNR